MNVEKKEGRKNLILDWLEKLGKIPTSKFVGILGLNYDYVKPLLDELEAEGKITRTEETLATYWEVKKKRKNG